MSVTNNHGGAATIAGPRPVGPIDNLLGEVTGVIESTPAARDAREALIDCGFSAREIHIAAGCDTPKLLRRGGFLFAVEARTLARRAAAAEILTRYGAHVASSDDRAY